jgi:uncharacterized protein (DUF1330 family)
MAKGYWISAYHSISNPDALAEYAKLAGPAIQGAGGKILARGGRVQAFEAGKNERTVLIEFENFDAAVAAYTSAGYKAALEKLGNDSVVRDIRVFEGID